MTSTVSWPRVIVATVVASALMQAATALLWMNPLTTRLILTPEFGQSQKLINVYTLLLALSSISIIPEADKLFNRTPAYNMNQLTPIALISADPTILVVAADRPWKSVKEFVEDAKRRPGEISFSSSGVYGTLHMATEMLSHAGGIKLKHVPFGGAGPALTAILGGHVDALASGPAVVLPHIKAGKLRPLAG